jgi:hypothetical protein
MFARPKLFHNVLQPHMIPASPEGTNLEAASTPGFVPPALGSANFAPSAKLPAPAVSIIGDSMSTTQVAPHLATLTTPFIASTPTAVEVPRPATASVVPTLRHDLTSSSTLGATPVQSPQGSSASIPASTAPSPTASTSNPVFHDHMKHIEVDYHFVYNQIMVIK